PLVLADALGRLRRRGVHRVGVGGLLWRQAQQAVVGNRPLGLRDAEPLLIRVEHVRTARGESETMVGQYRAASADARTRLARRASLQRKLGLAASRQVASVLARH